MEPATTNRDVQTTIEERFQDEILTGVSRTFALTIPQLPQDLHRSVITAYLLCRIADTIEDEVSFNAETVREFQTNFVQVLHSRADAVEFGQRVSRFLTESTLAAERELVANTDKVVHVFSRLAPTNRAAIGRCVERMCAGMPEFQEQTAGRGLATIADLDRYCYLVAGVVGEMLTDLFCDHSPEVAANRCKLFALASSFGQGLQMTNILKDVWEDLEQRSCWLPVDVFRDNGYDLNKLAPDYDREHFARAMQELIGIAHGHLRNALNYTLFIPKSEPGIRTFCIWCVELALLTLRHISRTPGYRSAAEVKVSKRELFATMAGTRVTIRGDLASRVLFEWTADGLPLAPVGDGYMSDYATRAVGA